jgi:plastocyanin
MRTQTLATAAIVLTLAGGLLSCGGSSPTAPSTSGGSGGGTTGGGGGTGGGTSATTITITPSGVSPRELTVPPGTRVTFVNNSGGSRDMASDPHPEHTDCPEINTVGFLQPGQSRQTANLNTVRVCGYHDHMAPADTRWQGRIRIE